jgi:hypothetical protein
MEYLDELILLQLKKLTRDAGPFVIGILTNEITKDEQISFSRRLVDCAEAIRDRAVHIPDMILEGGVVNGGDGPG